MVTRRQWMPDALGMGWVVVAGLVLLLLAMRHGTSLGSFDLLSRYGLSQQSGVVVHSTQRGDQIDEMIPWTALSWVEVHHGQLPLWNPYNALGLPLAFNWQSAAFSLPTLISFLVPLHLAYTVQLIVTLTIAGTGVYVLSRVLGIGVIGSTLAATGFELSGAFMGWLGWPHAGVASWMGWLLTALVLILRGRRRVWNIAFLAAAVMFMVYGGQPEILLLVGSAAIVFVGITLGKRTALAGGSGPILRPTLDISIGSLAGLALAAPLALPGLQLLAGSTRSIHTSYQALPPHNLAYFFTQGFDGLPISGNLWFGRLAYGETAAYVGVIVLVFATVAVAFRWRQTEVAALVVIALALSAVIFLSPVASLEDALPVIGHVLWSSALLPLTLAVSVLAGFGMDTLVHSYRDRTVRVCVGAGFLAAGAILILFWIFGRAHLTPRELALRSASFAWPAAQAVLGLAVVGILSWCVVKRPGEVRRKGRLRAGQWAGVLFLCCETAFLAASGLPIWSSSSTFFPVTRSVSELQSAVGDSLVGFGNSACFVPPTLGILQEANIVYRVHEFDAYDPITPTRYFTWWYINTGDSAAAFIPPSAFCPAVKTAAVARLYGVSFVLEPLGHPGPTGSVFDRKIGNEGLFRIPGAAIATLVDPRVSGLPTPNTVGKPVHVGISDPTSWHLATRTSQAKVLRLRLTDVPGWHASIDGRPLKLERFNGVMLQARIPPGRHNISLNYWPTAFTLGLILAALAVTGFVVSFGLEQLRRRGHWAFVPTLSRHSAATSGRDSDESHIGST